MFEKILEKVLENYFGRFITGLDKNNLKLGVWSGNVAIENVNLKPEVIELLELPIKLKHSKIGKMHFKIPWKKLSSAPVEILIDNLYITVSPLEPSEWNFSDQAIIEKKFQLLMDYCKECMLKNLKKKKSKKPEGEEDQSFLDKLTTKIIDNLQMRISNIHIRWEQEDTQNSTNIYKMSQSWGITLQSLDVGTTDDHWKKQFIDRTETSARFVAMNRLFELKNLAVYWNSQEREFLQPNQSYVDYMEMRILKDDGLQARQKSEFIITISSEVKVIQNPPKSVSLPLYHSEISLQTIDLKLNRDQFKQLLNLLESFSLYTNLLWIQRRKAQDISEQAVQDYQTIFYDLFQRVYLSQTQQLDTLQEKECALLRSILRSVGYENLISWAKFVAKKMIKENRVTHLTQKKLKKDSHWWDAAKDKKKKQTDQVVGLTELEIQDIENQIETMFDDHSELMLDILRPKDSVDKRFEFVLKGGSIQITSPAESEMRIEKEGIKLVFSEMQCIFEQVADGSIEMMFKLHNLELKMMTQYQGEEVIYTSFLQKSLRNQSKENQFFAMSFQKHVELQQDGQPQLTASLGLQIQPVECIYNPTFVQRFRDFFTTQGLDESLKTATWDKIEALQDQTQSKVDLLLNSDVKLTLHLNVFSPILILPFSANNDARSECWMINLGNLRMSTIPSQTVEYDCYKLELLQMSFQYYPSKELYYEEKSADQNIYSVLSSDTISFDIHRLKKNGCMPILKIDGQIPPLNLNLNTYLYGKIFEIKSLLVPSHSDIEQIEILQNEKYSILKNQIIQGHLKKKDQFVNLWTPYFGVCSGSYIYLFKDLKDIHPEQHVYIKKARIAQVETQNSDHEFAFAITSRYDKVMFSCQNQEELTLWLDMLNKQIDSLTVKKQHIPSRKHQVQGGATQVDQITYLHISLQVQDITITLEEEGISSIPETLVTRNEIYLLHLSKFSFMQTISNNEIVTEYAVTSLSLLDYIYKYHNPDYQTFIKSCGEGQFLQVRMVSEKRGDDWILQNVYQVDEIQLNWKPDVLLQLMKLFSSYQSNDVASLKDDEAQLKLRGLSVEEIRQIKLNLLIEEQKNKQDPLQQATQSMIQYLITRETVLNNIDEHLDIFTLKSADQIKSGMQILSTTKFMVKRAVINLLHQQTHTCLGFLEIEGFVRTVEQSQIASFNHGQIENLTLSDVTNYPHTIDSNLQFAESKVQRVLQKRDSQLPMMVFRQARYDRSSLQHRQTNFMRIEMSPVQLNYVHQPCMRFMNYMTVQMLYLVQSPEYLTMNSDHSQKPKLVVGSIEDIFKVVFDPTFSCLEMVLERPTIVLGRDYDDAFKIEICAARTTYSNNQGQESDRLRGPPYPHIVVPVWCDTIHIKMDQLSLSMHDGLQTKQVSNFSTYQVEWSKMLQFNEIGELFGGRVGVSNHFNIKSFMTPMNVDLKHREYQNLCAVLMHNFTLDDQQDALFIHDYVVFKSIAPNELRFMVYLPQFSLFMRDDEDALIANMTLQEVQVEYLMQQNLNKAIKFYSKVLEFSEFVTQVNNLEQVVIVGKLGHKQSFVGGAQQVRQQCLGGESDNHEEVFEELLRSSHQRHFRTNFDERQARKSSLQMQREKASYQFMTDVIMERTSPCKELILSFNNVGMSAKSRRVTQLIEWMSLTEDCYPPHNQETGMSLMINLNNAFLCFPTNDSNGILTAKGNINYIFDKQPTKSERTQQSHKITLSNLELFITQDRSLNKRQIVLPVLLYFGVQDNIDRLTLIRKIDCTFDRTSIKFSHEDLATLSCALEYQKQQLDANKEYVMSSPLKQYQTLLTFNCVIYGIQIVLTSGEEIPVPLFDLFLNECQLAYTSKLKQFLFNIESQIQSSHYNNSLGMWEPFVEPFVLQVDHSHNERGNPQQCTTVIFNADKYLHIPLNVNLTVPMILKLKNLLRVWQVSHQSVNESPLLLNLMNQSSSAQDIDSIQAVSPYILINKTGHALEISAVTRTFAYEGGAKQIQDPIRSTISKDESGSVRFSTSYDSLFQEAFSTSDRYTIERRKLTIKVKCEFAKFSEVKNIDFDKLYNNKLQLEMNVNGVLQKQQVVVDLRQIGDYKQLTISSDIFVNNRSQRCVELKMMSNVDSTRCIQVFIAANALYYIPLGYENAILQFRFQGVVDTNQNHEWSKFIDLGKVRLQSNDATFDLCPQSLQSLILLVHKPSNASNHFLQMKLQCPLVIYNTLPLTLTFKIVGVDRAYPCAGFQQIKVAERQPNQEFRVQVKLPGFQISAPIILVGRQPTGQALVVRDYLGVELRLHYTYIGQEEGFYTFVLGAALLIHQTIGLPLYLYGRQLSAREKEAKQQSPLKEGPLHPAMQYLAGQSIPGITDEEDLTCRKGGSLSIANEYEVMQLSFVQGGEIQSNREQFMRSNYSLQFPVKEALGRYLVRIPYKNGYMDAVAETTNIVIEQRLQIISPMLSITPKCIIVNCFDRDLIIKQNGVLDEEIVVARGQRVALYWYTYFSKYLQFYYKNNEEMMCKTGYIGLDIAGTLTCPTRRVLDSAIQDYILVSSTEHHKTQFIKVESPRPHTKPLYLLHNALPDVKLQLYQSCYDEISINLKTIVGAHQERSYAFDHPTHPKQLNIELIGAENAYIGMIQVSLTHANLSEERQIPLPDNTHLAFHIASYFSLEHKQIIVCFQQHKPPQHHEFASDMISSQLEIALPSMTISLMTTPNSQTHVRKEVVLVSVKGIEVVQVSDELLQTTQLKVQDIQIDSNWMLVCQFPVLMCNKDPKSTKPIISCVVSRAHNVTFVNYFKSIKVAIQPLTIRVTEGTLENLYLWYLDLESTSTDDHQEQHSEQQNELMAQQHAWQAIEIHSSQMCFIERVEVYPIIFTLSLLMLEAQGKEIKRLIKAPTGKSFMSCDAASIKLHGVVAENIQQTPRQFIERLSSNYQDDFSSNLLKLIGSMEILGNPMGLVRNVGEGFQDLWEMPKEGFIKGPIEGGIGIAKGVGSLTKGVVAGTFNTVQKITGSLAQGFSVITMDDEYQKDRAQMGAHQPKHLVDGLGQGMISLFTGVGQGIVGVFMQPVQGAEKDGIEGFFKGTLKGLAGLVVKPVVGVMDMTSKTAEGIKNTANYFDDKSNQKRYRPPRVFYSTEQYFKNFQMQDSEVVSMLQKINPTLFQKVELIECLPNQIQNRFFVYVLTINHFILLDVNNKSIKFNVPCKTITKMTRSSERELYVHVSQPLKGFDASKTAGFDFQQDRIKLLNDDGKLLSTLIQRLNHLMQIVNER